MTERFGYWNKVLHVDLSAGTTTVEEPGDAFFRLYGGGRAMAAHYLLKHVPVGADPLGPENVFVLAPGVVTGAPVPGAGRHSVGAMSPLSGGIAESESGGFFGAELKRAGWDGIVVHGASEKPVYLYINNDQVELRDASHLWGKITGDVEDILKTETGEARLRVAQCGPAGENLVRFACVMNDGKEAAGRGGTGAVMGSKKLKAVAVRGTIAVPVADKGALSETAKWVSSTLDTSHRAFHEYGTGAAMQGKNLEGGTPSRNFKLGQFDAVPMIDAVAVAENYRIQMDACYACSVRCKKVVQIEESAANEGVTRKGVPIRSDPQGRYSVDPRYGGPEYESLASLGGNLNVDDLVAICKANEMCNYLGMDSISAGATIAWAMEAYEKGLITIEDTEGQHLRFSHGDDVIAWLSKIAFREGYGDVLAEGSQRVAERIGMGAEEFLTTCKGVEMGMHDPRHMENMRHTYLLSPTGGDHCSPTSDRAGVRNAVGLCNFLQYDGAQTVDIINAVTGWGLDDNDLVTMAHRGQTLARLFNVRHGFTRADDVLPRRFEEDLPKHKGLSPDFQDRLVSEYYAEQGWDPDGNPTADGLRELGITSAFVSLVS
ncbi:MAG: aldehyde ferredoxin oxidoreductase family protein [Dehalococcoidia bacterium]|nr:aldehyde ferredoxin oxidoreductase family protein [Dehalococcoidia bacterium]MCB9484470.1 aldehyde ferredoxin oxidoreductase family protein [Thermoflexaceae bacterium]